MQLFQPGPEVRQAEPTSRRQADALAIASVLNPHLQTIYGSVFAAKPEVNYRRERWETPDGDFIDVDFADPPPADPAAPMLVLFHGLEGTLTLPEMKSFHWIVLAILVGTAIGIPIALLMPMTAVPQRTALSHAFGAASNLEYRVRRILRFPGGGSVYIYGSLLIEFLAQTRGAPLMTNTARDPEKPSARRALGAGPASLTVARDLLPLGYQVTVFEADAKGGGFMRTQVPRFRLPESVIDEETGYILDLGVEFRSGQRIESMKALMAQGYDAIFVGCGAPRGRSSWPVRASSGPRRRANSSPSWVMRSPNQRTFM